MQLISFEPSVEGIIRSAQNEAKTRHHGLIELIHLLAAMSHREGFQVILKRLEIKEGAFEKDLNQALGKINNTKKNNIKTKLSAQLVKLFENLEKKNKKKIEKKISELDLIFALSESSDEKIFRLCKRYQITRERILKVFDKTNKQNIRSTEIGENLRKFGIKLNAPSGLVERPKVTQKITEILARVHKNNAILIGDSGVGKKSLVLKFCERLKNREIWSFDLSLLLAGTTLRGQLEERLSLVLRELESLKPMPILFISDLTQMLDSESGVAAWGIIKNSLRRKKLQIIALATPKSHKYLLAKDSDFKNLFQQVEVEEPNFELNLIILKSVQKTLEAHHGIKFGSAALESAINLSSRYILDRALPEKAIDLLDQAASREASGLKKTKLIRPEHVAAICAELSGVPLNKLLKSEKQKLIELEGELSGHVIGQSKALEAVSSAIRRSFAGLRDTKRPVGSFFFLGPTGVGKTELAKTLTNLLFDDERALIRFDMSEFMEKHNVARLIGAPPGYKGADEGGQLTEAVKKRPYAVVLFDEVEKAHPDLLNILLQILDDGRLTDSQGNLVNFRHSVIIMTSNIGAHDILQDTENSEKNAMQKLKSHFRPEFLNRIDEIIMFNALSKSDLQQIAEIYLTDLAKRLRGNSLKLNLKFSREICTKLVETSYEKVFGARPLRRAIQKRIQDPLSVEILKDKFKDGDSIEIMLGKNKKELFGFKRI